MLQPGGRLALHEIMASSGGAPHCPAPWATGPALSCLRPPAEVRALLAAAGFREVSWTDVTPVSQAFFQQSAANAGLGAAPPPLGLHLLLGAEAGARFGKMARNIGEQRVAVIEAVFERLPALAAALA